MQPSLRSTVTPGKLPTCWFDPVSWLNSVVLPQFWLPTSANVSGVPSGRGFSSERSWNLPPSPRPGCGTGLPSGRLSCASAASRMSTISILRASSRLSVSS